MENNITTVAVDSNNSVTVYPGVCWWDLSTAELKGKRFVSINHSHAEKAFVVVYFEESDWYLVSKWYKGSAAALAFAKKVNGFVVFCPRV